jgi:hypothetical protein
MTLIVKLKDVVAFFQEKIEIHDQWPDALLLTKERLKQATDEPIMSALASDTLRVVKRLNLFEVWDDNCSEQYTGHTGRFREILPVIAKEIFSSDGWKDDKKVQQILACYVALYNGPLSATFLGRYQKYYKDRTAQRTLYIGRCQCKPVATSLYAGGSSCIHAIAMQQQLALTTLYVARKCGCTTIPQSAVVARPLPRKSKQLPSLQEPTTSFKNG